MKKVRFLLFINSLIFCISIPVKTYANDSTKVTSNIKIGLCLSGGGAKGLAHIGLLKLIDSLQIPIDYITGTSMGSVVGGLYACGYSGKQIDSISKTADWSILLGQYPPMDKISIDEKDEFQKYLVEVPFEESKPKVTGFIEGQELLKLFLRLTQHVSHISDFSKLPIPYKCMAVDVINVQPVILDHGSLALAMRASMAIPTVFKPVKWEDKLLVDGGVLVNFPVQQLKDMGATFIIGSYTGGRLLAEEEMNTFAKILLQTSSFYGIQTAKDQITKCDLFNNLSAAMTQFSAGDFKKSTQILAEGDRISKELLPDLINITKMPDLINRLKPKTGLDYEQYTTRKIKIKFASDNSTEENRYINKRTFQNLNDTIEAKELNSIVEQIYGTRNYFKVYYHLNKVNNESYNMQIITEKDVKFRLKAALHFDNEIGAGIVLNLTARNWLSNYSRLVITLDLAQAPRFRIHYRKYINQSNIAWNVQYFRERNIQKIYNETSGLIQSQFINNYSNFSFGYNYNVSKSKNTMFYTGVLIETSKLKPYFQNDFNRQISGTNLAYIFSVQRNTLNHPFFAINGSDFMIESKMVLVPIIEGYGLTTSDTLVALNSSSLAQPYLKIQMKWQNWLPVSAKFSIVSAIKSGFFISNIINYKNADELDLPIYKEAPITDYFFLGGVEQRSRKEFVPIEGLKESELTTPNFLNVKLGLQYQLAPKTFICGFGNYLFNSTSINNFTDNIQNSNINFDNYIDKNGTISSAMLTYGIDLRYKSFFGPIIFNVSKATAFNIWRAYFSIGLKF